MQSLSSRWVSTLSALLSGVLLLCAAGCATKIDWVARVGNYTVDQAIVEFGPPDKQAKLSDGSIVAEWLTQRSYNQTHVSPVYSPGYYGGGYYGPAYSTYSDVRIPDYFLRLIFAPDGKLTSWKKFAR